MGRKFEFGLKLVVLSVIFLTLILLDYRYHEELAHNLLKNYAWLGYFRYNMRNEFMYSVDVIVGSFLFLSIVGYGAVKRKISNLTVAIFPIVLIMLHYWTIL